MKYLVSVTEIYRVDTEEEATDLINQAKKDSTYELHKYSSIKKEKKSKKEIEDEWYRVTLVKNFTEEKDPIEQVKIWYEV